MEDLHPYANTEFFERVTPLDDIPTEFRMLADLPNGGKQVIDRRRTYNWNGNDLVECGSVAGDARFED